jgi:tRNA(fMet)-specific endonuclease VapC
MTILDTDHLSILEWHDSPAAVALQRRLDMHDKDEVCTTIVSYEEQVRGWLATLGGCKKVMDQIEAYRRLNRQLRLYCAVRVLDFDERAAAEFQRLRKSAKRIGTMDLKMAAIALVHGAVLATRNSRDFRGISGLVIEDWTLED